MRKPREKNQGGITRREAIRRGSAASLGLAVAGGIATSTTDVFGALTEPRRLILPLNLDNHVHLEAFLRALGDPEARVSLRGSTSLPESASQLLEMVDDPGFLTRTNTVVGALDAYSRGVVSEDSLTEAAEALKQYVTSRYPEAMNALTRYATAAYPDYAARAKEFKQLLTSARQDALEGNLPCLDFRGRFAVSFCTMANYAAVVNFGVYTNVAVATFAVLALAAAFVVV